MASDMFMKVSGVDGESKQTKFENWIELSSFSMSSAASGSTSIGTGAGVGKVSIHGVNGTTVAGKHTPTIAKKYFNGEHFEEVKVVFIKQTGDDSGDKYYELIMKHVFFTSIQNGKGEGSLGSESFSLTAESYEQEYWAQDEKGKLTSVGKTKYEEKLGKTS